MSANIAVMARHCSSFHVICVPGTRASHPGAGGPTAMITRSASNSKASKADPSNRPNILRWHACCGLRQGAILWRSSPGTSTLRPVASAIPERRSNGIVLHARCAGRGACLRALLPETKLAIGKLGSGFDSRSNARTHYC